MSQIVAVILSRCLYTYAIHPDCRTPYSDIHTWAAICQSMCVKCESDLCSLLAEIFNPHAQQKFVIWCVTLIVDVLNCNHNNYYYNHIYMYVCHAAIFELLPTIITHCMHQTITWYLRAIWTNAQHFLNVTHNLSLFGWGHIQISSSYSPCSYRAFLPSMFTHNYLSYLLSCWQCNTSTCSRVVYNHWTFAQSLAVCWQSPGSSLQE